MDFNIASVKLLLQNGQLEVQDGVSLISENKNLKPVIYVSGNDLIVEFEAPFLYLHVTKIGPKRLLNLVKPRVEYIKFKPDSTVVKLSTLGEWEVGDN
jgi:hypothetical protein